MFKVEDKVIAKINGNEVQGIVKDVQTIYGKEWRYVVEYKDDAGDTASQIIYHEDVSAVPVKAQAESFFVKNKK
jgi:hypothetical protein